MNEKDFINLMHDVERHLQFGHLEKVAPGNFHDFFCSRFFAGLINPFGVMTAEDGVIIRSEPSVRSRGSGLDPPTH